MSKSHPFSQDRGFGVNKPLAIKLLKQTLRILDKFHLKHCLIAGTLLGYERHRDIIPWDDDIDLLVDPQIRELLPQILQRYGEKINIIVSDHLIKFCFRNHEPHHAIANDPWTQRILENPQGHRKYTYPFIDLFTYQTQGEQLSFFGKNWESREFFPLRKVKFLDLSVNIPRQPHYFLKKNYSGDYMNIVISSHWKHKDETLVPQRYMMTMADYLKLPHPNLPNLP